MTNIRASPLSWYRKDSPGLEEGDKEERGSDDRESLLGLKSGEPT